MWGCLCVYRKSGYRLTYETLTSVCVCPCHSVRIWPSKKLPLGPSLQGRSPDERPWLNEPWLNCHYVCVFGGTECLLSGGLVPRTVLMAAHPARWDRVTELKRKCCPANASTFCTTARFRAESGYCIWVYEESSWWTFPSTDIINIRAGCWVKWVQERCNQTTKWFRISFAAVNCAKSAYNFGEKKWWNLAHTEFLCGDLANQKKCFQPTWRSAFQKQNQLVGHEEDLEGTVICV